MKDIPIRDNGEPLVDFVKAGLTFAPRHPVFPFPRVHLARQGLVDRLLEAQRRLPDGWKMVIVEAFRTIQVQRMQHVANQARFAMLFPYLSPEERQALIEDFSAPPDVAEVPPPHSTGGAVDIHLEDAFGHEIDIISPFSPEQVEAAAWDAPVSDAARRNREMLRAAMETGGVTNYPGEYWHWSYGDQGWAHRGGHPHALYNRLEHTVREAEALQGEPANREPPLRAWPVELPEEELLEGAGI
ncbi:MAG TPA: M15 family metallopeptidase [Armatimonadota bacterium]